MFIRSINRRRISYILAAYTLVMSLALLAGDSQWGPYVEGHPAIRVELAQSFKFGENEHAALSPNGRNLALQRNDTIEIWDVESQTPVRRIEGQKRPSPGHYLAAFGAVRAPGLLWSPDSRLLAVGTANTLIRVVDATTGQARSSIIPPSGGGKVAYPVDWSPDGRILIVRLVGDSNPHGAIPNPVVVTTYMKVDPGSGELTLLMRDPSTDTVGTFTSPFYSDYQENLAPAIAWSPNGTSFVSHSFNYQGESRLACWDAYSGKTTYEMPHSGAVTANWSANGQTVAYADRGAYYVRLADCKAGQDRGTLPASVSSASRPTIRGLAWSPDGQTLATYTTAGLTLWQKNGSIVDFIPEQEGSVGPAYNQQTGVQLTWSPDGRLIATSESFGTSRVTKVWDLLYGGPPQMLVTTGAGQVMWAEDSSKLLVVYNDSVAAWRVVRE